MKARFQAVALLSGLVIFIAAAALRGKAAAIYDDKIAVSGGEYFFLPESSWTRVFSVGYNEAAADLIWIKAIVYLGGIMDSDWEKGELRGKSNFTIDYLRRASDLDPKFLSLYTIGSVLTLYHRGNVTKDSAQMCIDLLERGLKYFPDSGKMAFKLGFVHFYEMVSILKKNKEDEKVRFHKEEGARLLRRAALMEDAPSYAYAMASKLLKEQGLDDLVVETLQDMLIRESKPQIRESIEAQLIAELGKAAERDIKATGQLQLEWRNEFPYIDYGFYLVLRPQQPVTTAEILNPLSFSEALLEM